MPIRLYVDPDCPRCQEAERFLTRLGRVFVVRDIVGDRKARLDLLLCTGRTDVPVLQSGYEAAIGFDEENWLTVLRHGDAVALHDPLALPEELGPDPTPL